MPLTATEYTDLTKQALLEYSELLNNLIKSAKAENAAEKQLYLDSAADSATKANALAGKANEVKPTIEVILKDLLN